MTPDELLELKNEIEEAEQRIAKDEGVIAHLWKELSAQGFDTMDEVDESIEQLSKDIKHLSSLLEEKLAKIEEMLED